jgi:hypothetical protein
MLVMFVITCLFYRGDQALWEKQNGTTVVEAYEPTGVSDYYEGYLEPWWIVVAYSLQIPGLLPVRVFTDPLPLHTKARWPIYGADIVSILAFWFVIGFFFEPWQTWRPTLLKTLPLL